MAATSAIAETSSLYSLTNQYQPHLVYARVSGGPVGDAPRS